MNPVSGTDISGSSTGAFFDEFPPHPKNRREEKRMVIKVMEIKRIVNMYYLFLDIYFQKFGFWIRFNDNLL